MNTDSDLDRLSHVDNHITITVIGDSSKTILMPLWGSKTNIPGAWLARLQNKPGHNVNTIIWDVMQGSIVHMFPSDSVDHTILFYDMSLRRTDLSSRKYSITDYLRHIVDMKGSHKRTTCIIINDQDTGPGTSRGEIIRSCKQQGIKDIYILNNVLKDISSLKSLVYDITCRIYQERRDLVNKKISDYLTK